MRHRPWPHPGLRTLAALLGLVAASEDSPAGPVDGPVIGIDLGTTFSCVAVARNGMIEVITNDQGNRMTPSVVAFQGDQRLVGEAAKNVIGRVEPTQVVYDVKRFLGRPFKDTRLSSTQKRVPYRIEDAGGSPVIKVPVNGKDEVVTPESVSSMVLAKLKQAAETYLDDAPVKHAVIAVPAHFNEAQRRATKEAASMAGLNVLRLVGEPTAAALAYALDQGHSEDKSILVYDLGGGTLDVSLLRVDAAGNFTVLATGGEEYLGGEDFSNRVVEHYVQVAKKKFDKDLTEDAQAMQTLRSDVEKAKCRLSAVREAPISVSAFAGKMQMSEKLTRARFEEINKDLFERTLTVVKSVLQDAGVSKEQVDHAVLVGGSTRIPKIQALVKKFFDGKEILARGVNPDEAVAYGAAALAREYTARKEGEGIVNLVDVTPLTLGVELAGGVMSPVISRNCLLPCANSTTLSTYRDNQPGLRLKVFQGERLLTKNNHFLGSFKIGDIAPAPRGEPQIEVTFVVDENGLLSVKAEDRGTGAVEELAVTEQDSKLPPAEVERMLKDAEEFAEADLDAKERAEVRVLLDELVLSTEAILDGTNDKDGLSEKLDEEDKQAVKVALMEAKDWLAGNLDAELAEIQEKHQEVEGILDGIFSKHKESAEEEEGGEEGGSGQEGSGSYDEL